MTKIAKYPGWRTMTASQRCSARIDRSWEHAIIVKQADCKHLDFDDKLDGYKCRDCGIELVVEPE